MKSPGHFLRNVYWEFAEVLTFLRRCFYMVFRRDYVRKMLARRRGTCEAHGCCWNHLAHRLVFRHCTDPTDRTRCLKWENLPKGCRMYPFDEKDKDPKTRSYCNFYWVDESQEPPEPPGEE